MPSSPFGSLYPTEPRMLFVSAASSTPPRISLTYTPVAMFRGIGSGACTNLDIAPKGIDATSRIQPLLNDTHPHHIMQGQASSVLQTRERIFSLKIRLLGGIDIDRLETQQITGHGLRKRR